MFPRLRLVAASERGICAILLGDDPKELEQDLRCRFAKAQLALGDRDFKRSMSEVIRFVDSPGTGLGLPLDVRGTAFQKKVWSALEEIPFGSTTSYSDLARQIGLPRAVRAVAGAVAANNIAVAIPCHRVIRANGDLCGYRWGVERKRALLAKERRRR